MKKRPLDDHPQPHSSLPHREPVPAEAEAAAEELLRQRRDRRRAAARVFEDGQLLAGRYRVLELLKRGASGQVYMVIDEELGERVALKTLHPGVAASPRALDLFKREILVARSITHENVCRLFELGRHVDEKDGDGESDEPLLFLTMELVEGETLADLAGRGPLNLPRVIELAGQVALGLRAAHRKGIVHRDLKGQNILVEKLGDETYRLVLTDFGLARAPRPAPELGSPESGQHGVGAQGEIEGDAPLVGTPLTMAPEQVRGGEVGEAADIYAFGVLLYHLTTGTWPFTGTTPLDIALSRLEKPPPPPRRRGEQVPAALENLILECLRIEPAERPHSVDEILERLQRAEAEIDGHQASAISGISKAETSSSVTPASAPRPSRPIAWASFLVILCGLVFFLLLPRLSRTGSEVDLETSGNPADPSFLGSNPQRRPSLLWLGFIHRPPPDLPPDPDAPWLATLVEKGMLASLAAGGGVRLVEAEEAARIRRELPNRQPGPLANDAKLRRRADVEYLLSGSARSLGPGRLELEIYLQGDSPATPSQPMRILAGADDLAGLGDQVAKLAGEVRGRLSLAEPTVQQASSARAEIPSHPEAARLYAKGISEMRRRGPQHAAALLQKSLELEHDHPKVLAALSTAWSRLGHGNEARSAARRAFEHSGGLSRAEQMTIEARYRLRQREWRRAEEIFKALWEFYPDDASYALGLAEAQDRAGEIEASLATLDSLRRRALPPGHISPLAARADLVESMAAYHQGDYERSQRTARRAREISESLEAPTLMAEALVQEALTRIITDEDLTPVEEILVRAIGLLEQLGESRSLVRAQLYLADCARRTDRFDEAEAIYRRAIENAVASGNNSDRDRARTSLAILLDRRGFLRQGLVLKQEVLQSYRERQVHQGAAITQENIAISLLKMGRPADALEELAAVEERYRELGDRIGLAWSPYYQGRAWLDRGELKLAERHLRAAEAPSPTSTGEDPIPGGLDAAVDFELARLAWTRGDSAEAAELATSVIAHYEEAGNRPFDIAESKLLMARIERAQSNWRRAESLAREALAHFDAADIAHQIVAARAELVDIEWARFQAFEPSELPRGSLDRRAASLEENGACRQLSELRPALETMDHRRIALLATLSLLTCQSLDESARGQTLDDLEVVLAEADRLELFLPELRARILRAQILKKSGRPGDAQATLQGLEQEARERGFASTAITGAHVD